jgi:NTE family protein
MSTNAEFKSKIPENIKKTDNQKQDFNLVVSEGSTVTLEAVALIKNIDINSIIQYSWNQTYGIPIDKDNLVKDNSSLSFTAPYVKDNDINTRLEFELTVKDNSGKTRDPLNANVIVKRVHRAIIFQGGVALGAYEAGVFQFLVENLVRNDKDKKRKGVENEKRPLFDIVAGTSIGAMNGAIVVSSVKKEDKNLDDEKNWQDSANKVLEFWREQQYPWPTVADSLDMNPLYHSWWDNTHEGSKLFKHYVTDLIESYSTINPELKKWYEDVLASWSIVDPSILKDSFMDGWYIPATAESARRYYSAKQFLRTFGAPNVASGLVPWSLFGKFFDFFEKSNYMPRSDNKHFFPFSLKKTLGRFADFPIKTSFKKNEPRLLLVTVDVKTGDAVTFDSYSGHTKYHDDKLIIQNQNGIEMEHALATGTFPDFFDYPKFKVNNNTEMGIENEEEHIFWDGGFKSNTPLREVLQAHRDYWLNIAKEKEPAEQRGKVQGEEYDGRYENVVPDLEIYIADLWPSELKENPISFDRDFVENRKWDLLLGDKTAYDEQVANVVTDYIDLTKRLKNLAKQKGASDDEINHILNSNANSINTQGETRKYGALLEGRFRITQVVRIDHKDDGNEVHDKVFDYSYQTIERMIEDGYKDASIQMEVQSMKKRKN